MSSTITLAAPAIAAPWIAFRPTPPAPITTTELPGRTAAVFATAPKPVITPQASSEAASRGRLEGIATTCDWSTTTRSAKAAVRSPCTKGSPPGRRSGLRSSSGNRVSQVTRAPWLQEGQCPQERIRVTTTWSPGRTSATPEPTARTTPAASCP